MTKYMAAATAVLVLLLGIAVKYGISEHDALVTYTAQVAQVQKDNAAAQLVRNKTNEEITGNIALGWKSDHDRLTAALNGMRKPANSGVGAGAGATDSYAGNDAVPTIEGGTCAKAFYDKALNAELLLETWQAWGLAHNLKVVN